MTPSPDLSEQGDPESGRCPKTTWTGEGRCRKPAGHAGYHLFQMRGLKWEAPTTPEQGDPADNRRKVWVCPECERVASVAEWVKRPICVHAWKGNAGAPEVWDGDDVNGEGRLIEQSPNESYRSPGPNTWAEMARTKVVPPTEKDQLQLMLQPVEHIRLRFSDGHVISKPMIKDTSGGDALEIPQQNDKIVIEDQVYRVQLRAWDWNNRTVTLFLIT